MPLLESTHHNQSALANYCRTGKYKTIAGVNKNNIPQYRRLVFDIMDDMLQSAYPLTYNLLSHKEWSQLTKEFLSNHPCSSPQVWYMPKELHQYLSGTTHPLLVKYPYLLELVWFEWLEIELYMMEDKTIPYSIIGDIQTDELILNPESHFQYFQYPVHLKKAKAITEADQANYYLSIHRVPKTGDVLFTDISPALLYTLELLSDKPRTAIELIQHTCQDLGIAYTSEIQNITTQFINESLQSQLIIGFTKKTN